MLLVQSSECCLWGSGESETGTPPHHQLSTERQACAAKAGPASSGNLMRIYPLFHCAEPVSHPVHTVHYTQCRKQLLTVLFIIVVLFVLHQWSTTLNNVLIFLFFFFPPGLQKHSIWRLQRPWWFKPPKQLVRSVSHPCYRREADRHRQQVSNPKSCGFLPFVRWW